jgi:hypothetical protein
LCFRCHKSVSLVRAGRLDLGHGTVLDIDNPPPDEGGTGTSGLSRYRFSVDENIIGAKGGEIDVYSGRGGGDCSYHFRKGHQYLVFPYKDNAARLLATICSPTRPIEEAQAILPQLRAMRDHQPVASLYGVLRSVQQPLGSVSDEADQVLSNTRMELRSENMTFETVTDSNGGYAFYDLPEGEFHFAGDLPEHLEFAQEILGGPLPALKIPARACFEYDVTAMPSGHIRGRVLGPDGKPLSFAAVDLFRAGKYAATGGWYESQDRDKGYFEFQNVGPGDYVIVYNNGGLTGADEPYPRTFYPGVAALASAKVVHVEAGQKFDEADIRVSGGVPTREITIRLVAENGELPDVNYVEGRGSDGQLTTEEEVSPGVYSISILKGVQYDFHGEGYCSANQKESTTNSLHLSGSDDSATDFTLMFHGAGCPRKTSDEQRPTT